MRFNTLYTIYEGETFDLPTENLNGFFWDTFRIEARGAVAGLGFTFEYRFYPGFNTHFIKKGFLSYEFLQGNSIQLGVAQVPFGMLEILGNSWWFQLPYYVGLEDDYDTGLVYVKENDNWIFHLAYFLMAEPRGVSEPDFGSFMSARYSYDVIPEDGYNGNKERHQGNFRAEYTGDQFTLGGSFQAGQIYNSITNDGSPHWAIALHSRVNLTEKWKLRIQASHYKYPGIRSDNGTNTNVVNMGAYGFGTYQVASEGTIYSVGMSYKLPVKAGPITSLTFYNDYSLMNKFGSVEGMDFITTHQNVLGFLVEAQYVYAYFDIASGINHPWLSQSFGGPALASGRGEDVLEEVGPLNPPDRKPSFNTRFNINLGIYFMK